MASFYFHHTPDSLREAQALCTHVNVGASVTVFSLDGSIYIPRTHVANVLGLSPIGDKLSIEVPELTERLALIKDRRVIKTTTRFVTSGLLYKALARFSELDDSTRAHLVTIFTRGTDQLARVQIPEPVLPRARDASDSLSDPVRSSELDYYEQSGIDDGEPTVSSDPSSSRPRPRRKSTPERKENPRPRKVVRDELVDKVDAIQAQLADMHRIWQHVLYSPAADQPTFVESERARVRAEIEAHVRATEGEAIRQRVVAEAEQARDAAREQVKAELLQNLMSMLNAAE